MPFPAIESLAINCSGKVPQPGARRPINLIAEALAAFRNRNKSADARLQHIIGSSLGSRSLREACEDPHFLASISKRVDQLGDASVHNLIKRYLAES